MGLLVYTRMAKVLIIDDDPHVSNMLKAYLSEDGYEVVVAHRALEGLHIADTTSPDLILLDVMLPDATGFQLCKELRRRAKTQATPIVMMSGVARYPNQKEFGLERGANEYILKPFQIFEVGEIVNNYIRPRPGQGAAPTPAPKPTLQASTDPSANSTSDLREYLDRAMNRFKI